eukprot:scaffold1466_cov249-Pinguiococcus_pyrenoidosus.AAC.4
MRSTGSIRPERAPSQSLSLSQAPLTSHLQVPPTEPFLHTARFSRAEESGTPPGGYVALFGRETLKKRSKKLFIVLPVGKGQFRPPEIANLEKALQNAANATADFHLGGCEAWHSRTEQLQRDLELQWRRPVGVERRSHGQACCSKAQTAAESRRCSRL